MPDTAATTVEIVLVDGFLKARVNADLKDLFVYSHEGPVPFDLDWPEFLRGWVQHWVPLEGQPISEDAAIDPIKLGIQDRSPFHTDRKYLQAMYNTCALYTYDGEAGEGDGEATGLWERATIDTNKPGRPVGVGP